VSARAVALGVVAALAVALVYGLAAEAIQLTFGLIVVALVGGYVIGQAVKTRRPAVALSIGAWVVGLVVAYVVAQALLPQASTSLGARLSAAGFVDYLSGLDVMKVVHPLALAATALAAWRGAR
jgi:hypothetical protein